jgi:streptogramin lyase
LLEDGTMSLRNACLFSLIVTVLAFAATGTLKVPIKEYEVPTPKSRPHDPARAPDGSLWYTGQGANQLGRPRSKNRRVQGVSAEDAGIGAARLSRRPRREHLVHGHLRWIRRQARSEDG